MPTLEVPSPVTPDQPVVPETPTVPADPTPDREAPNTPTGPDAPEPDDPLPPQPDGPDVPAPDPAGPRPNRRYAATRSIIGERSRSSSRSSTAPRSDRSRCSSGARRGAIDQAALVGVEHARVDVGRAADRGRVAQVVGGLLDRARDRPLAGGLGRRDRRRRRRARPRHSTVALQVRKSLAEKSSPVASLR